MQNEPESKLVNLGDQRQGAGKKSSQQLTVPRGIFSKRDIGEQGRERDLEEKRGKSCCGRDNIEGCWNWPRQGAICQFVTAGYAFYGRVNSTGNLVNFKK